MSKIIILVYFIIFCIKADCQKYLIQNLTTKDGLASNTIYSLAEDDDGQIWFGTKNGANRYDGRIFKTLNSGDGLLDNEVLSINHIGKNKMIAISFLDKFSFGDGFKFYSYDKFISKSNLSQFVFKAEKTPYRNPSIILNNDQSYFINLKINQNRLFEVIKNNIYDSRLRFGLDTNSELFDIHKLSNQDLLLFTRNKYKYNYTTKILLQSQKHTYDLKKELLMPEAIQSFKNLIYLNFMDTIWVYRLDTEQKEIKLIKKIISDYVPHKIIVLNKQVIPLNQSGYSDIYDTLFNKIDGINQIQTIENISDILEDKNNNVWISTLTNGVYFLKKTDIQKLTSKDGLISEDIHSIACIEPNINLVGDNEGRVYLMKENKAKLVYEVPKQSKREFNIVYKIIKSKDKTILLTYNPKYNVCVLDKNYKLIYKKPIDITLVKSIFIKDDKTLLLGGISRLYQLNLENNSLTKIPIDDIRYSNIYVSKCGDIWIGSNNGIYCYQKEKNKMIYLGASYTNCQSRATAICESQDGVIWVGTSSQGLIAFYNYKPIAEINHKQGLASGYVHSILSTNEKLWISTNSGLYWLNYSFDNKTVQHIHISNFNGIGNMNVGEINTFQLGYDKIYLGTSNGLFYFPNKELNTKNIVNTVLTSIKINNADSPIRNSYVLPSSINYISFKYTGISFGQANEQIYYYRMKGIDEEFQKTKETIKEYGPLDPGEYLFEVYCGDENGKALGKKVQVKIEILPAFYQKLWVQALCILFLIFLIYIFNQRLQKNKQVELNSKIQIAELEMQAIRAQINPHFIFNCLNGIQQLINIQDGENANRYIAKFAKLIRQTLELSKNNTVSLEEEIEYLNNYLILEKMRFQERFDFQIIRDSKIKYNETIIPSMLLQPYVENSIRHGFKYLEEKKGHLSIEFKKMNESIQCIIEDNGIGRKASAKHKASNPIEYQSRGTELNQKRLDNYNYIHTNKIESKIEDVVDSQGEIKGTRVVITIN